jgi:hypothetical protein
VVIEICAKYPRGRTRITVAEMRMLYSTVPAAVRRVESHQVRVLIRAIFASIIIQVLALNEGRRNIK